VSQAVFRQPQRAKAEWHALLLRGWHIAILRYAITRDNADRLGVLAVAIEMDRLGRPSGGERNFRFFRKTSAALCAAILRDDEQDHNALRKYLGSIDEARLRQALAAALDIDGAKASARRPVRQRNDLWKGLPSRVSQPDRSIRR
jgi:hypothetical protein